MSEPRTDTGRAYWREIVEFGEQEYGGGRPFDEIPDNDGSKTYHATRIIAIEHEAIEQAIALLEGEAGSSRRRALDALRGLLR